MKYKEVVIGDIDYEVLEAFSKRVKKYVVCATEFGGLVRRVYGTFRSARSAWKFCRQTPISLNPLCYLMVADTVAGLFVNETGRPPH